MPSTTSNRTTTTRHSSTTPATVRQLDDLVIVDPSELSEEAQEDLAHLIRWPVTTDDDGALEAYCGQLLAADDPEAFNIDLGPAPAHAPDDLQMLCARCYRIREVVHAAVRAKSEEWSESV